MLSPLDLAASPIGRKLLQNLSILGVVSHRAVNELTEGDLLKLVSEAALRVSGDAHLDLPPAADEAPTRAELELARLILESPASSWWEQPWQSRTQIWTEIGRHGPPTASISGLAPGKPPAKLWTSSEIPGIGSAWTPIAVSGVIAASPIGVGRNWEVSLNPSKEVFEIDSHQDWVDLCLVAPKRDADGFIGPDWSKIAESWSGVHLTLSGLIAAQGVSYSTDSGPTMLRGWDAESTAWLEWCVVESRIR